MKKSLILIASVLAIATAVTLTGCKTVEEKVSENITEKAIETATGGKANVDIDEDSISVSTDEGTVNIGTGKLPSGFPSDIPIYDDAEVTGSTTTNNSEDNFGGWVGLKTSDSVSEVTSWYKSNAAKEGWGLTENGESSMAISGGQTTILSYSKGDRNLSISISSGADDDTTSITLTTTAE